MVAPSAVIDDLGELLDKHAEWLIVDGDGRTFPVERSEIEIEAGPQCMSLGTVGDRGFRSRRIVDFASEGCDVNVRLATPFGGDPDQIRLVPRTSAAKLAANIELARLERAKALASLITRDDPNVKIVRIGLNRGSGRFAEIIAENRDVGRFCLFSDLAGGATAEVVLATSILWFERLRTHSKKPIRELHIVSEKRSSANLQKLHALLKPPIRRSIRVFELGPIGGGEQIKPRAELAVNRLWREKPKKLKLPDEIGLSETARKLIELSPEVIDVMHSRHGETLRFNGLAFARVRQISGTERAWFGIERTKRPLTSDTWADLKRLIGDLENYRSRSSASRRHEFYRQSPESWLESILRRNIKLLDPNLVLAPIYNQFRTAAADKIDLLALRRDGRLVVIEIKASPDRETPFQAADYWRKIEHFRRQGELKRARVFEDLEIADKPALVYAVAPALSFHRDFEHFARMLTPEIELWRFELHENWREEIKVIARRNYTE